MKRPRTPNLSGRALLLAAVLGGATAPAAAQERRPLELAVPESVHYFVDGTASETPDPWMASFERAVGMLVESGVHDDIFDLATLEMSDEERQAARGVFDLVLDLLGRVDWALLVREEVVFAYTFQMPLPEYVFAFRVPESLIGGQVEGMKSLFTQLGAVSGGMVAVQDATFEGGAMSVLAIPGAPVQPAFGAVGDVLVLTTSREATRAALERLASGDSGGSLAANPAYETALEGLPESTEATFYVDTQGLARYLAQTVEMATGFIPPDDEMAAARGAVDCFLVLLRELANFQSVGSTTVSDGVTVETTVRSRFSPGWATGRLAPLFAEQRPWEDWHRHVPADATAFSFDSGLDLAALYDLVFGLIEENFDNDDEILGAWEYIQGELGFRMRDVLAAFAGESAYVSFPSADGSTECVARMRLDAPEPVAAVIEGALHQFAGYARSRGQDVVLETRDGLHELRLAAFPWIQPVVGVRGDELVVATSGEALDRLGRVLRGEEPNIRSSSRFGQLGLGAADDVEYLAYGQMDASIEGVCNLLSGAGFVLSLMPDERDLQPAIKLGAILTKLAPVLRELDVQYDWGYEMVAAGADAVDLRAVTRYR